MRRFVSRAAAVFLAALALLPSAPRTTAQTEDAAAAPVRLVVFEAFMRDV